MDIPTVHANRQLALTCADHRTSGADPRRTLIIPPSSSLRPISHSYPYFRPNGVRFGCPWRFNAESNAGLAGIDFG